MTVNNDDLSLKPGMTATAEILVAETENALVVPSAALRFAPETVEPAPPQLLEDGSGHSRGQVFVSSPGGVPEERALVTGLTDGTYTVVVSGDLEAGEAVIYDIATQDDTWSQ